MTNNITNEQKAKALAIISNTNDSKLETHLNACVRCGLCASSCMYYLTMKEGKYIPARKVDLVSSIYRRYKTWQGAMFPSLFLPVRSLYHVRTLRETLLDRGRHSLPCEKRT